LGASGGTAADVEGTLLLAVVPDDDDDGSDDDAAAEAGDNGAAAEEPGRDGGSGVLQHQPNTRECFCRKLVHKRWQVHKPKNSEYAQR